MILAIGCGAALCVSILALRLTWRVVYRVDLGALDRTRKAARVALVEATTMLHNGVDPMLVAAFIEAALQATSMPSDTMPVPG